ncbi:hypothetical protein HDU93_002691 [Gonapodya sp. JEL0774]|nr:hypothetical protein HDU93_002691 [Gonapodya sp. JEL0774]
MRVFLNGPSTVLATEGLVQSSPVELHAWMSTPCFLISTTSAGNISRVLESVLDMEGDRGMDFASPLLWSCIWKSSVVRAVSVRAVRVFSGVSVNGRTATAPAAAQGIDPAAVVARETRELAAFRRAVYAIRKWWVPTSEARSKRAFFEQVFHEVGFPVGWKPNPTDIPDDDDEERVAKMAAVVVVREEASVPPSEAGQNHSAHGSPGSLDGVPRPYPVHPLSWPEQLAGVNGMFGSANGAGAGGGGGGGPPGSVQGGESTDYTSDMDDLDVQRALQDAQHYELAVTPAAGVSTPPAIGIGEWDLQFTFAGSDINAPGTPAGGGQSSVDPPAAAQVDALSGGQSTWRSGISGGMYGYLGSPGLGLTSPAPSWGGDGQGEVFG